MYTVINKIFLRLNITTFLTAIVLHYHGKTLISAEAEKFSLFKKLGLRIMVPYIYLENYRSIDLYIEYTKGYRYEKIIK